MRVNCSHWSDCGVSGGGCCDLSYYGGKPSTGVCNKICPQRQHSEIWKEEPSNNAINTLEKSTNDSSVQNSEIVQKTVVSQLPIQVQVQPASRCNRCKRNRR